MIAGALAPRYYYGKNHDYVYYPESWTDESSGISYQQGYYDENGQYYSSVSAQENGKYENVICKCPYCGQETILNLTAADVAAHNLQCPHCGGPMEIQSELEDYLNPEPENTHSYTVEEPQNSFTGQKKKKKKKWPIVLAVLAVLYLIGSSEEKKQEQYTYQTPIVQQISTIDSNNAISRGSDIRLVSTGANSYAYSASSQTSDKHLVWQDEYDSYYDADSDCWLWYNTDVEPPLWQYWYEGISSDYGDYGWMEHSVEGWYIEESEGNWIELPSKYDTAALWYIED